MEASTETVTISLIDRILGMSYQKFNSTREVYLRKQVLINNLCQSATRIRRFLTAPPQETQPPAQEEDDTIPYDEETVVVNISGADADTNNDWWLESNGGDNDDDNDLNSYISYDGSIPDESDGCSEPQSPSSVVDYSPDLFSSSPPASNSHQDPVATVDPIYPIPSAVSSNSAAAAANSQSSSTDCSLDSGTACSSFNSVNAAVDPLYSIPSIASSNSAAGAENSQGSSTDCSLDSSTACSSFNSVNAAADSSTSVAVINSLDYVGVVASCYPAANTGGSLDFIAAVKSGVSVDSRVSSAPTNSPESIAATNTKNSCNYASASSLCNSTSAVSSRTDVKSHNSVGDKENVAGTSLLGKRKRGFEVANIRAHKSIKNKRLMAISDNGRPSYISTSAHQTATLLKLEKSATRVHGERIRDDDALAYTEAEAQRIFDALYIRAFTLHPF